MLNLLWTLFVILVVLWVIGLAAKIGGALIHLLLLAALVVLVINLFTRRTAV